MKTSKRSKLLGLALTGSLSLLGTSNALAAAGDTISNTATLSYSAGGVGQADIGSSPTGNTIGPGTATTFVEDRKINFTVARTATQTVGVSGTAEAVAFTITNNGNTAQNFLLRAQHLLGAADPFGGGSLDIFTPTALIARVESGATAGYQPLEDTAVHVSDLAGNGGVVTVYVVSDMPALRRVGISLFNGDIAVVSLVAQVAVASIPIAGSGEPAGTGIITDAINNDDNNNISVGGEFQVTSGSTTLVAGTASDIADTIAMETVFADPVGAGGTTSAARSGEHADASTYTMQVAALTVTKTSAAHYDDINGLANPKSIPGSLVRYTVTIANAAGAGDATLTQIVDLLPLVLDTKFNDNVTGNLALSGANNVRIIDGVGTTVFCQADNADANTDGCRDNEGGTANNLRVDLTAVGGGLTNILTAGQTLTIEFDVVLP